MNQCPYCNNPIKTNSIWCPSCGNRLLFDETELSFNQRIDNVRSAFFGALRFLLILLVLSIPSLLSFAFLAWLQSRYGLETAPGFEVVSIWLRSLIEPVISYVEYLYRQHGDLIQITESIASLSTIVFGLLIFSFLGIFESIFRLTGRKRSIRFSQTGEFLNAKVMEATVYGNEVWVNEDKSFPFNWMSLTIKINNKRGSSRYITYIRLEPEFIGKHGLMSIKFSLKRDTYEGYSYTANQMNLLWAVTILPLKNLFARIMRKQKGQAFLSTRAYVEAPMVDMEAIGHSENSITSWLFDRYTDKPLTLSKWIDMSTLPDIFFLNIIVRLSDELVNYQRKHLYAGHKVTIRITSEDGITMLTKLVDFKSSQSNDDDYARIQRLIGQNDASI